MSIRILRTIAFATFIPSTKGSLCGEANLGASLPPNTIMGTVPESFVRRSELTGCLKAWPSKETGSCLPHNPSDDSFEGSATLSLGIGLFVPYRPTRGGLFSAYDTRLLCGCYVCGTHNIFVHCKALEQRSSAVVFAVWDVPALP